MPLRVRVCRRDDIPPEGVRTFEVPGLEWPILIARVGDAYYATTSRCPHAAVSLSRGRREGTRITCPGHGYIFDLETGACAHDAKLRLRRYAVSFDGDDLYVELV